MPDINGILSPAETVRAYLEVWTCDELAAGLGVTTDTLRIWRCEGKGPSFVKAGRTVFYRIEDVRSWLKENTYSRSTETTPTTDPSSTPNSSNELDEIVTATGLRPLPPMQEQDPHFPEPIGVLQ